MSDVLPVALRCHVERTVKKGGKRRPKKTPTLSRRPGRILVIDVETSTDATPKMKGFSAQKWSGLAQSLLFGRAILAERKGATYEAKDEWVFYPDDLPPEGVARLRAGIGALPLGGYLEPTEPPYTRLRLLPLSEFLDVFWKEAVNQNCLVVGFNVAFDLAALARDFKQPHGERFAGGFELVFWQYRDKAGKQKPDPYRSLLRYKHIDSKRTFFGWTSVKTDEVTARGRFRQRHVPSRILDLRTLIFALTSESHGLDSAARTFLKRGAANGVPEGPDKPSGPLSKEHVEQHGLLSPEYVHYNRTDVLLTLELANHLLAGYDRHPISTESGGTLPEARLFSPASVAKGYLDTMGIRPRLALESNFPKRVLGYSMTSYFGGRVEIMLRKVTVPIVHLDFLSLYPTVNSLMGLWPHVIAERIDVVDATEQVQRFLDEVTLEDCFKPGRWEELNAIALVEPRGDILPVRGHYQRGSWNIGLNPYNADPQYFALPDLVASKLLTEKAPHVLKAYRFVPVGRQKGMRPTKIMNAVSVDPTRDDFFKKVIEERIKVKKSMLPYDILSEEERESLQMFLKILANSGSYGIYAEVNPVSRSRKEELTVYGLDAFATTSTTIEKAGRYYFPPMATLITSGARLMLALLERSVMDAGGSYVLCDTDSMMVVATPERRTIQAEGRGAEGAPIPQPVGALFWREVRQIVERFAALNPYDRDIVPGSILKIEDDNYTEDDPKKPQRQLFCHAISAKRYGLACQREDGSYQVIDAKESGFGFLLNPLNIPDPPTKDSDTLRDPIQWENRKLAFAVWDAVFNGKPIDDLPWANTPCVYQLKVSSWHVYTRFKHLRALAPSSLRPGSFVLTALPDPFTSPTGGHIIAPFEKEPTRWQVLAWTVYSDKDTDHVGKTLRLVDPKTLPHNQLGRPIIRKDGFVARTVADYVATYLAHPEVTTLGPDGKPCSCETVGPLSRRPVSCLLKPVYVGKEGTDIDSAEEFFDALNNDGPIAYGRENLLYDHATAVLADLPADKVASDLGVAPRTIRRWLSGEDSPEDPRPVLRYAVEAARQSVDGRCSPNATASEVLAEYVRRRQKTMDDIAFVLARMPVRDICAAVGCSPRHAYRLRGGVDSIKFATLQRMVPALAEWCSQQLSIPIGGLPEEVIGAYRRQIEATEREEQISTFEAEQRRAWKTELRAAIRAVSPSGIARHADRDLSTEYKAISRSLRARKGRGRSPDEVASDLAELYPWLGICSEDDLYAAFS